MTDPVSDAVPHLNYLEVVGLRALQFHLGLRITPVAQGYRGLFDVSLVLEALRRGAACNVDLSSGFDVFLHKDRSLGAVRASLGIPPLR